MVDSRSLADLFFREEVARARAMNPGEKLFEGPRLCERACRLMADGIRHRHPDLDEVSVRARVEAQSRRLHTLEMP